MSCSLSNLTDLLDLLDASWSDIWTTSKKPTSAGLYFGSRFTVFGSLGILDVQDLDTLHPEIESATISHTTCGSIDYAHIVVPLTVVCSFQTELRASGYNTLWPLETLLPVPDFNASGRISGHLLLSVPCITKNNTTTFLKSQVEASLAFYGSWTLDTIWPDAESVLYHSVPFSKLMDKFIEELNTIDVGKRIAMALQSSDESVECTWPTTTNATCLAATSMPMDACDPCDKCCVCLVQQKCDEECTKCPCVKCSLSDKWVIANFISTAVVFVFAFLVLWLLMR